VKNKTDFLKYFRVIIYIGILLASVIVLVNDMGMNTSFTIIFTVFLLSGTVGLFIEIYKK
jgi:hypothetical protein